MPSSKMGSSSLKVLVPTQTSPSHDQYVVGRSSPVSSEVDEFRGIPYGIVPARWKHSELRRELPSDTFDATKNGPKCPQPSWPNTSNSFQSHLDFPNDSESEFDCLNLFITRPSNKALARIEYVDRKLPVLIWIHGGGYGFGAATDPMWDPARLVLNSIASGKPMIAVGLNYRLHLFGFGASSEIIRAQADDSRKGCNFGVRDAKLGVQWVSQNIASFGGDPAKITIAGQSAGASSVDSLVIDAKFRPETPHFRRAIIQSGAVGILGPRELDVADKDWEILSRHFGFQDENETSRIAKLQDVSAEKLLQAAAKLKWIYFPTVIDNITQKSTSLGCKVLVDLEGHSKFDEPSRETSNETIEILIGDTEDEFFSAGEFPKNITFDHVQSVFEKAYPSAQAAAEVFQVYSITDNLPLDELHRRLGVLSTDAFITYWVHASREFFLQFDQSNKSNLPSSSSSFHHTPVESFFIKFGNPFPGPFHNIAHHCVDLIYLFDCFHDALAAIDESTTTSDPQLPPAGEPAASKPIKSNLALSHEIQAQWIDFITRDGTAVTPAPADKPLITIYGADRLRHVEAISESTDCVQRKKRYDVLAKNPDAMMAALRGLI